MTPWELFITRSHFRDPGGAHAPRVLVSVPSPKQSFPAKRRQVAAARRYRPHAGARALPGNARAIANFIADNNGRAPASPRYSE